jgi:hypothetical protein
MRVTYLWAEKRYSREKKEGDMRGKWWVIGAVVLVGLLAQGQWVLWEQNFETETLSNLPDVKNQARWYIVDSAWFYAEDAEVRSFPSGSKALYFGMIDKGKGTYENARVGGLGIGYQVRIDYPLDPDYQLDPSRVRVSFKYLREVEYYQWGDYDITEVSLTNFQSPSVRVPIWVKSSKDPSEKKWRSFTSDVIDTTLLGTQMAIEFSFRPLDANNNNYFGWLVDDVKLEAVVAITHPASLDDSWEVDKEGRVTIYAAGGVQYSQKGYKWKIEGLPEGLRFSPQGTTADISGTPVKAGVYTVKITVTDYADEASKNKYPASTYTRTYTLVVKPKEDTGAHGKIEVNFEQLVDQGVTGPDIPGWTRSGLWHFNSDLRAACYFDRNTGNYDTGKRTSGELTSPKWDVSDRRGQEIRVRFNYYRNVEDYPPGGYDKTYVDIRFDDGSWTTIWYKDSSVPSPESETADVSTDLNGGPLLVPANANTMQIRFVFDSVDGLNNDNDGWRIWWVQIEFMAGELEIVTTGLPPAEVGVYYEVQLEARGGTPPYDWTTESRLPTGLRLERTGKLCGIPEGSGAFTITIKVTDQDGDYKTKDFRLTVGEKTTLFNDDFEGSLDKWVEEDWALWHRTKEVKDIDLAKYGCVIYYGKDDTTNPNYNTGARTYGYLTSNPFALDGASFFQVTFDYWREVEFYGAGGYDQTYVQVRFLIGTSWSTWYTVWSKDCATPSEKAWTKATIGPYSVPSGATKMQIRFVFDSVDRFYNNYVGWLIDNVKVAKATSGSPLPTSSLTLAAARGEITFQNIPNPVRDVHTTTFVVRGVEAERIRVEVYDLAGKLVWKGEALGNELTWHTEDLTGLPLANGVYLYKVYVKVGEAWIVSDVKKLVILR